MRLRLAFLVAGFCVGCQTLLPAMRSAAPDLAADPAPVAPLPVAPLPVAPLPVAPLPVAPLPVAAAVALAEPVAASVEPTEALAAAADHMAKGDDRGASLALARYIERNPDHRNARLYLAELLLRLEKRGEAAAQFEQVIACLQNETKREVKHLVHCHTRLLEIAEMECDEYLVNLHRGIGLYWLAQGRSDLEDPEGMLPAEGLLCKAAGALSAARGLRPAEARPCWYLYGVWRSLGQDQPAQRWLREAEGAAPFSHLSPAEQRSLQIALTNRSRNL